jgi:hypothetical protein
LNTLTYFTAFSVPAVPLTEFVLVSFEHFSAISACALHNAFFAHNVTVHEDYSPGTEAMRRHRARLNVFPEFVVEDLPLAEVTGELWTVPST